MKKLELSRSVHDLCQDYPELLAILDELGFADIGKPGMLNTVGRVMTLPKGARVKRIDLEVLKAKLAAHGFTAVDDSSTKGEQ